MKQKLTGIKKRRLYYIGDLPPEHTDGITTSFAINLEILKGKFLISQVSEQVVLGQSILSTLVKNIGLLIRSWSSFIRRPPDLIYINYPLSFSGSIRTLMIIFLARIFAAKIFVHVHRGDIESSYLNKPWNRVIAKTIIV